MASPIGYLIHHDASPPPAAQPPAFSLPPNLAAPIQPPSGSRTPLVGTPAVPAPSHGPTSAPPPSLSRPGPEEPAISDRSGAHSKTQSLYQCADCLRRYSRPEHLQRHIAAHTLGKRFTCDICSKGFARADLLKRHRANHLDENGTKRRRFNSVPSASRVGQACQGCAKARVKCEEVKPCTRCKTRGLACEVASSEDAAMYLVHLSGNTMGHRHDSTPDPPCPFPSATGQPHHQLSRGPTSSPFTHSVSPEESKEGITTPRHPRYSEDSQLPTPETSNQSNPDTFQSYPSHDGDHASEEHARPPFSDFLRDVLYDQSMNNPPKLAETPGMAVLDFYDDANLDFKEFDFALLDHWNFDPTRSVADQTSESGDPVITAAMPLSLVKIWTESPWRWQPQQADNCYTEQSNLPLPSHSDAQGTQIQDSRVAVDRVSKDVLHGSCRDRIMGTVLSTCRDSSMSARVASSFPSAEAMDSWINIFLAAHLCQVSSWLHYGSLSLNKHCTEWLATAAAAGAVLTPVPAFRRFGFALQEAIRVSIPEKFEENNRTIADLGKVQALVLIQDIGLWSGNRRKMEIAECHLLIPITMMRYRGKFGRSAYPDIVIYPSDEGKVLEEKWKTWYQHESWKRLVFHSFLRDAQVSMTQFNNPLMSYAELSLPLPCSKKLWFARSAGEFKNGYLKSAGGGGGGGRRPPSLCDLFRDINALSVNHHHLDIQFAISIYLHGFWSLIWEYRQQASIHSSPFATTSAHQTMTLLLDSRRADLINQLKTFELLTRGWHEMLSAQESMLLSLLLLNLYVPLLDLQLFIGKEGEDQARRVYPSLQRWVNSADARQALWHAGQVLRQGKLFPRGHLKDFWAVGVHHAALCMWAYGVVTRASMDKARGQGYHHHQQQQQQHRQGGVVYLDGEESPAVQGWLDYAQGRPAIQHLDGTGGTGQGDQRGERMGECLLEDPRACVKVAQEILKANFVGIWESLPPLSENIIVVLKQLEKSAWAVGVGDVSQE
ncbi:hypothetical protein VTI74DRAFT_8269 [Chaetomium olivicolor]